METPIVQQFSKLVLQARENAVLGQYETALTQFTSALQQIQKIKAREHEQKVKKMSDMVRIELKQVKTMIDDLNSLTDKPIKQRIS